MADLQPNSVSDATHGMNQFGGKWVVDFCAQVTDIDVDDIGYFGHHFQLVPHSCPGACAKESLTLGNEIAHTRIARKGTILQSAVFVYARRFPASAVIRKASPIIVAPADPKRD